MLQLYLGSFVFFHNFQEIAPSPKVMAYPVQILPGRFTFLFLQFTQLSAYPVRVVGIRHIGKAVLSSQRTKDLFVNLVADIRFALKSDNVFEAGAWGNRDCQRRW